MPIKSILIDEQLHRRIKVHVTLSNTTIKDWVSQVLEDALDGKPSASVLIDSRGQYVTQGENDAD